MIASPGNQTPSVNRERQLFLAALEISDRRAREAFVRQSCGRDNALRVRLEGLLSEQAHVGDFLEVSAVAQAADACREVKDEAGGTGSGAGGGYRIGPYQLIHPLGEGGCGVVYLAEQEEPVRRKVALKVIKLGMDTRSVISRFEAERQALALMEHPNIAKVLDGGATEAGRPFFVMELVEGVRITDYCNVNGLTIRERLNIFVRVCQAIQHAHQKGVIHRDIKPSNILVTVQDPGMTGEPKVIDFGIAKAIPTVSSLNEKTWQTEYHAFLGTPAYMSPEQAELGGMDIDTRTDIYSLGILLYELLAGQTPFDTEDLVRSGLDECRRRIREEEPIPPSNAVLALESGDQQEVAGQRGCEARRLISMLRGDLDWIAMKCLEKDRVRRYATAHDLAMDVLHYLNAEPIMARPPSNVYRMHKFVRRYRGAFAAAAAIMATLFVGAGVSVWQAVRATHAEQEARRAQAQESALRNLAEQERGRAEKERASARLNEYVADINLAQQALAEGNYGRSAHLLNKHRPAAGEPDLRGFEWRYLWNVSQGDEHVMMPRQQDEIRGLAFSSDGRLLALGLPDSVNVWDVTSQMLVATLEHGADALAFLPGREALVAADWRGLRVWHTGDWSLQREFLGLSGPLSVSRDGRLLAVSERRGARVLDTSTWETQRQIPRMVGLVSLSPDGNYLAGDTWSGIRVWSLQENGGDWLLEGSTNVFLRLGPWMRHRGAMAFSPDGRYVVAGRNRVSERGIFGMTAWEVETGKELWSLPEDPEHVEHTGMIWDLAFSPDGRMLATASADYSVRLWDIAEGRMMRAFHAHISEVLSLAFSPDGTMVASGSKSGGVKLWSALDDSRDEQEPNGLVPLTFAKDSEQMAALNHQGELVFYHLEDRSIETRLPVRPAGWRFGPPIHALSKEGNRLAFPAGEGQVEIVDLPSGQARRLQVSDQWLELLELSGDGNKLVSRGRHEHLRWWDLASGLHGELDAEGGRAHFSPDGQALAVLGRTNAVRIFDMEKHALRGDLVVEVNPGFASGYSPDGRLLAVGYFDSAIRMWDWREGELAGVFSGHKQPVFAIAFSPDGKTMASCSDDRTLKFWNVETQQELLSLRQLGSPVSSLVFSPSGRYLAGGSLFNPEAGLRLWHAPSLEETDYATMIDGTVLGGRPNVKLLKNLTAESLGDF